MKNVSSKFRKVCNWSSFILLLIPITYIIISLLVHFSYGFFYQNITDPEYFHLLNGINVALFNLATPYVDHPGTPLQVIVAISSWPTSFFIPGSIVSNVIDNPELFITTAIILMNIIIAVVLFVSGKKVYSYTHNIWLSLLIQLMPLGNIYAFTVFGRLTPESFMIVPIILTAVFLIRYLYDNSIQQLSNKQLVYLALLGGLGMAIKFSYLPFLLIPIFIIRRFSSLIKYGLFSIVSTLIFAFPIIFNFSKTVNWFGGMLLKSGTWGEGGSVFINWAEVPHKLSVLLRMNLLFTFLIIMVIVFIIVTIFFIKNKSDFSKLNRVSGGVILAISLSIFLITKHFAPRYYFPTLLFQVVLLIIIIEYLIRLFPSVFSYKKLSISVFILFLGFIVYQAPAFADKMNKTSEEHKQYSIQSDKIQILRDTDIPVIIDSHFSGCPFPEFSISNGYLLCGNLKSTYHEKLRSKYPKSIFYVNWSDQFFHWNHFLDADNFIDPNTGVYIFIGRGNEANLEIIMERLQISFPDYKLKTNLVIEFDKPKESFYKVDFSSVK